MSISPTIDIKQSSVISPKKTKNQSLIFYRICVFYRFALALLGGYVLSAIAALFIVALFKPISASVVLAAMIFAFVTHIVTFVLVFLCRSNLYASLMLFNPSALLYACLQIVQG